MYDRYYSHSYPNRTMCEVLDEMRECYKSRNFAPVLGLIEEVQIMGNKMEASLNDKKDLEAMREQRSKMNEELEALQKKINKLKKIGDASSTSS